MGVKSRIFDSLTEDRSDVDVDESTHEDIQYIKMGIHVNWTREFNNFPDEVSSEDLNKLQFVTIRRWETHLLTKEIE